MLPSSMLAMAVDPALRQLVEVRRPLPSPGEHDILVRVMACGVCRTDLHVIDGDLPRHPRVIPGHEVVGEVVARGSGTARFAIGERIGIPWLGGTCGVCPYCTDLRENLCDKPLFTGYDRDGGFAEYVAADERYCLRLPRHFDHAHAAPLLCAGLIGFRAWRMAGADQPRRLGLYGFGAAAHIVCQIAVTKGQELYAFTRAGDNQGQQFARSLGATWAGDAPGRRCLRGAAIHRALANSCADLPASRGSWGSRSFTFRRGQRGGGTHPVTPGARAVKPARTRPRCGAPDRSTVRRWPPAPAASLKHAYPSPA